VKKIKNTISAADKPRKNRKNYFVKNMKFILEIEFMFCDTFLTPKMYHKT